MTNTITTDRDVRTQITAALAGREAEFDIELLTEGFISRWGCVDIDAIPCDAEEFWTLVADCAY